MKSAKFKWSCYLLNSDLFQALFQASTNIVLAVTATNIFFPAITNVTNIICAVTIYFHFIDEEGKAQSR